MFRWHKGQHVVSVVAAAENARMPRHVTIQAFHMHDRVPGEEPILYGTARLQGPT